MVSRLALGAIWGYQQFLSPRKGYRCAYSVLHGGTGCSGFAKFAIRDHGLWGAIPEVRKRFRDCKAASKTLRANCALHAERDTENENHATGASSRRPTKRRQGQGCMGYSCFGLEALFLGCGSCGFAGSASGQSAGGGGIDCGMPDCGSCDCAPSCG